MIENELIIQGTITTEKELSKYTITMITEIDEKSLIFIEEAIKIFIPHLIYQPVYKNKCLN
jgi:hypothetical protein